MKKTLTTIALVLTSALVASSAVDRVNTLQATSSIGNAPQLQQLYYAGVVTDVINSTTCIVRCDGGFVYVSFPTRFFGDPGSEIDFSAVSQGTIKYENSTLRHVLALDWK